MTYWASSNCLSRRCELILPQVWCHYHLVQYAGALRSHQLHAAKLKWCVLQVNALIKLENLIKNPKWRFCLCSKRTLIPAQGLLIWSIIFYKRRCPYIGIVVREDKQSHWQSWSIIKQRRYRGTDRWRRKAEIRRRGKLTRENVISCKWCYLSREKSINHSASESSTSLHKLHVASRTLTLQNVTSAQGRHGWQPRN